MADETDAYDNHNANNDCDDVDDADNNVEHCDINLDYDEVLSDRAECEKFAEPLDVLVLLEDLGVPHRCADPPPATGKQPTHNML